MAGDRLKDGPLTGVAAMLCFDFGTVPSLVTAGVAGQPAERRRCNKGA